MLNTKLKIRINNDIIIIKYTIDKSLLTCMPSISSRATLAASSLLYSYSLSFLNSSLVLLSAARDARVRVVVDDDESDSKWFNTWARSSSEKKAYFITSRSDLMLCLLKIRKKTIVVDAVVVAVAVVAAEVAV